MAISFLAIFLCNIHGSMPAAATFSYGQLSERAGLSEQLLTVVTVQITLELLLIVHISSYSSDKNLFTSPSPCYMIASTIPAGKAHDSCSSVYPDRTAALPRSKEESIC